MQRSRACRSVVLLIGSDRPVFAEGWAVVPSGGRLMASSWGAPGPPPRRLRRRRARGARGAHWGGPGLSAHPWDMVGQASRKMRRWGTFGCLFVVGGSGLRGGSGVKLLPLCGIAWR